MTRNSLQVFILVLMVFFFRLFGVTRILHGLNISVFLGIKSDLYFNKTENAEW